MLRLEVHLLAQNVDVGVVEELTVNGRLGAGYEMAAADGEDFAHSVAAADDALGVGVGGPDGIVLDELHDGAAVGDAAEKTGEGLAAETLLPDAPKHPVVTETGEVGAYVALVLGLLVALGGVSAGGGADVLLDSAMLRSVVAPFAAEIEMLCRLPKVAKDGVGEASCHIGQFADGEALTGVDGAAVGEDALSVGSNCFLTGEEVGDAGVREFCVVGHKGY